MIDAWIGDVLVILMVANYPYRVGFRGFPRILSSEPLQLPEAARLQSNYENRYWQRFILNRALPIFLAIYFGIQLFVKERPAGPGLDLLVPVMATAFILSLVVVNVVRLRKDQAFARAHPAFADSVMPVGPRIRMIAPLVLGFALMGAALSTDSSDMKINLTIAGVATIFASGLLQKRFLRSKQFEIPWDGPLGERVSEVVRSYRFQPKKLILFPSLMANAYALTDGSVMVTTSLRLIATDDEIAAVIAHELSHVRDQEGKKIVRWAQTSRLPSAITVGIGTGYGIFFGGNDCLFPFAAFLAVSLSLPMTALLGWKNRPLEYKCDRDAKALGLGSELASCLDKITRYLGLPGRWIGLDRFLVTHPSLEDRVARLTAASD